MGKSKILSGCMVAAIAVIAIFFLLTVVSFLFGLGFLLGGNENDISTGTAMETLEISTFEEGMSTIPEIEDISGSWSVINDENTFVGYRINEVLTTIGDFEVVGRTPSVSGKLEADGLKIFQVELVAQVDTLTTDSAKRDQAMRKQALETEDYPEASFVLTAPIELSAIPEQDEVIEVTAAGDLTIHGVTNSVDLPLEARLAGQFIFVVGQLDILLSDYGIDPPSAPIVASVEDNAVVEFSILFGR